MEKLSGRIRGVGLYLLPAPLALMTIVALFKGDSAGVLSGAFEFTLFTLAAMVARHGFRLERKHAGRPTAHPMKTPWKTLAAGLLGLATGATAWLSSGYDAAISLLFGLGAFASFLLLYGLDPRRKRIRLPEGAAGKEVLEILERAEARVAALERAAARIHDPGYASTLRRIVADTREIIEGILKEPADLARSRKFLNTHLAGMLRVTDSYLRVQDSDPGSELRKGFGDLLNDFERTVQDHQAALLENDRFDLEVQIEVLETQLDKDGIH